MKTVLAAALAALVVLPGSSAALAQAERRCKTLMLGDSVTKGGMAPAVEAPLNELTRGRGAWTLVNAGVGGETAEGGKARLAALLDAEKPDVLTVSYGLNDLAHGHTPEQFRANMLAILDIAARHDPAPRVILLTATPFVDERHSLGRRRHLVDRGGPDRVLEVTLNAVTRRLAAEKNLPLLDLHRQFMTDAEWKGHIRADGVHLTAKGYAFCGKYLAGALAAWHDAEVARDPKAGEVRDAQTERLAKLADAAKEAATAAARERILAGLNELWRACPWLPAQAILWHTLRYAE